MTMAANMQPEKHEHEVGIKDPFPTCKCTDVIKKDDHTFFVYMANGGHIRIVSETPLKVFCQPQEYDD